MYILMFVLIVLLPMVVTIRKRTETSGGVIMDFDCINCFRGVAILLIMLCHIAGTMGAVVHSFGRNRRGVIPLSFRIWVQ